MRKFCRFVAVILITVFAFGLFPAGARAAEPDYDPMNTMLALNMAIVSVHKIVTTEDRIILDQEYQNIINNLKLGNIKADYELTGLVGQMMDFMTGKKLNQEETQRFVSRYKRKEQEQLADALSKVASQALDFHGDWASWGLQVATSCASTYFSYQGAMKELHNELDDNLWMLKKDDIRTVNELQKSLLRASWELLNKYSLPDEYRLTQDGMDNFYKATREPEAAKRLWMLRNLENEFHAYPPYWFYRAQAARQSGDGAEAKGSLDRFDEVWRPVLRKDPYKVETAKLRLQELADDGGTRDVAAMKKQLEVMRENTPRDDWSNNLFAGMAYFALGEKDKATECVRSNIYFDVEKDVSEAVLKQMETGKLDPDAISARLWGVAPGNITLLRKAAENGDPEAQNSLGMRYFQGNGVEQDYGQAAEWFRKAAEQGHAGAQHNLGLLYANGMGVPEDDKQAAGWYRKAAEQGYADAQYALGVLYANGTGVAKDDKQAVEWFRKAAEQGHVWGQYNLGAMFDNGRGEVVR